jgi:prevent-host-death family protein
MPPGMPPQSSGSLWKTLDESTLVQIHNLRIIRESCGRETVVARVPASEFQREFGRLRGVAHREAVIVTSHGRDDVVLLSAEEYQRLRSLDRRAIHVSELTEEELAALESVEIPAEAARYNHELT